MPRGVLSGIIGAMLKRNRWFVTLGLIYGLLGGLIGLAWLAWPQVLPGNVPRLHGHLMLLGFVAMMIYGIALHVLPRFSGRPLYSERLADVQFVLANVGLLTMAAGWLSANDLIVTVGGGLTVAAMAAFAANVAFTVRLIGPRG